MSRWRVLISGPAGSWGVTVAPGGAGGAEVVLTRVREALRAACESGGCRTINIAVHVEGPDCDHEVEW